MIDLKEMHASLYEKLSDGKFTVQKTNRKISILALDQNHEQLNAGIKGVGGAFGLTENDAPFQRWLITDPEIARPLKDFEILHSVYEEGVLEHHDLSASIAKRFSSEVKIFLGVVNDLCDPFLDGSLYVYFLDTKVVVEQNITAELVAVEDTGKKQLPEFFGTRLHQATSPITNTICKNM